jgi:hypothetical protein
VSTQFLYVRIVRQGVERSGYVLSFGVVMCVCVCDDNDDAARKLCLTCRHRVSRNLLGQNAESDTANLVHRCTGLYATDLYQIILGDAQGTSLHAIQAYGPTLNHRVRSRLEGYTIDD